MTLYDTIFCRKSNRAYDDTPLSAETLDEIRRFVEGLQPLFPGMRWHMDVTDKSHVDSIQTWRSPHYAIMYAENHPMAWENIGFVGQMLDLYLQSRGIGCCWVGLAHLKDTPDAPPREVDGMRFIIMLAVGMPKDDCHRKLDEFKRRSADDIADAPDERLEPARFAPSAVNSQPWYFTQSNGLYHIYKKHLDPIRDRMLGKMNRIDTGIALAHMAVANPDTFRAVEKADHPNVSGYDYWLSFSI